MTKLVKGLHIDNRPQEQPEGTYPFGKNGIQNDVIGSVFNEPGFRLLASVVPYQLNGIIETDDKPVLFSTNNTNSAIGYFNPITELYEPIINDNLSTLSNWDTDWGTLGFTIDYWITGQAQRNYKGELIVAFTDKNLWPKYLNCDDPSLSSIDDLRLFPFFRPPVISSEMITGGRLEAGTYYIAVGYERNDGTSTAYSPVSKFITIPPLNGQQGITDKAIQVTISSADTSFDSMRIAIISKIAGKTTAVELSDFIPVTGSTIQFLYTGDNLTTDIDVSSILVQPAFYDRVDTIGQLNDALYIAGLHAEADLNMQQYANIIQLEFVSELIDAVNPPQEHISGTKKGLMHEEVYAFYIRYRKTRGGTTKWFTIPGNAPLSGDTSNSTEATAGGGGSVPKFKVEDTIPYYNASTLSGGTGVWRNGTETYPDTIDFDSTALGGTNLRNGLVRHHKMPTLRWCKEKFYSSEGRYGKTHLDLLGIKAVNVRVPDAYTDLINGYEIGYAKRNIGNMTVYGQSVLMHGAQNNFPPGTSPIYTTGGNFNASYNSDVTLTLRKDTLRFHAFDILFNKPSITPDFISGQLKLRKNDLPLYEDGYAFDSDGVPVSRQPIVHLIDYTDGTVPSRLIPGRLLRGITDSTYLTVDINTSNFINLRHENTFAGMLLGSDWDLSAGLSGFDSAENHTTSYSQASPLFEETYLVNLIAVKSDLYSSFFAQNLVSAGSIKDLTDVTPFFGGDIFVADYTFHTYGRHNVSDETGEGTLGIKVVRRFVCESVSNINLRYETTGNDYSKWYPNNGLVANRPLQSYITLFDRSKDPNQFGYSKDFNALNDLTSSVIFNPFREELTDFPYRIHRGGKNNRQARPRSWRTFLPLDYYELQKNMGRPVHLEGMDDHLLIHCERALFITRDKATLEGGDLSVVLGTGDIFQFEPQPGLDSKLGYAGTQHELACVKTPIGYIFVDAQLGEMYIYKGQLTNINLGLNTFLREYLKIRDKNVFNGNGITIGWDQKYKRILLTVKNKQPADPAKVVKIFENVPAFWNDLETGDIVSYNGRLVEYKGENTTEYDCPEESESDVITWQKTTPSCVQVSGNNTGMRQWANRIRLTNGVADGYTEANSPNGGIGPYFPPVYDTTSCPLPSGTITWQGSEAYCEIDTAECPDGYTLSDDKLSCVLDEDEVASTNRTYTGILAYNQRCRLVNGIPDGYCEDNATGANHVASVTDHITCPVPESGLGCGAVVNGTYNGSDAHDYDEQVIAIVGTTVNLHWEVYDRPNKFSIYKDGSLLLTTGWKGYAGYSGPWGTTLPLTSVSGTLSYVPAVGSEYTVVVQTSAADPDNFITDAYRFSITCGS